MYKSTQPIEELITFDVMLKHSISGMLIAASSDLLILKTLMVLSLTTGLEMKLILTLKWKDLLTLGSENDATAKHKFQIGRFDIPINSKVGDFLSETYTLLGFPELTTVISEYKDFLNRKKKHGDISELIIKSGSYRAKAYDPEYQEYFKNLNSDRYLQVIFGRKVLEVCGYSNETSKFLKKHFHFKLNQELLDFLGYTSIEEIRYELCNINLTDNQGLSFDGKRDNLTLTNVQFDLEDINFNTEGNHPFQKFSAFSKFITGGYVFYSNPVSNSVRLLLWISLFNGIRPSTLIKLQWKDIVQVNEAEKTLEILKLCRFHGFTIKFGVEHNSKLLDHLSAIIERKTNTRLKYDDRKLHFEELPNLDTPVFISNTDKALTQPSLLREIKKFLKEANFPHTSKFTTKSTMIMYGRRIMEIKGNHEPTIQKLKQHFGLRSSYDLFTFLQIDYSELPKRKEKEQRNFYGELLYDL